MSSCIGGHLCCEAFCQFVGAMVPVDDDASRALLRGRWGIYTVTPKNAKQAPPCGGWQVRCPWHRSAAKKRVLICSAGAPVEFWFQFVLASPCLPRVSVPDLPKCGVESFHYTSLFYLTAQGAQYRCKFQRVCFVLRSARSEQPCSLDFDRRHMSMLS